MIGEFARTEETGTGQCAVLVHGIERTLCANIGASAKSRTEHLTDHMAFLEAAKFIYSAGFFITSNNEALRKICHFAAEHDKPFGFNLSAVFLLQFEAENIKYAIEHADFVFCNEDEASAYNKLYDIATDDRVAAAKHIVASKKAN